MPRCSLRARGGSSPCSPCSPPSGGCAWLRVAPVPAPSGAALALRCAPWRPGRRRDEGCPAASTPRGPAGPASNKGLGEGSKPGGGHSPAHSSRSMARKRTGSAVQRPQRVFRIGPTSQGADSPQQRSNPQHHDSLGGQLCPERRWMVWASHSVGRPSGHRVEGRRCRTPAFRGVGVGASEMRPRGGVACQPENDLHPLLKLAHAEAGRSCRRRPC